MKVFVTGGTGVLGRRAIPLLVEAGHDVTASARSGERADLVTRLGARPVQIDVFDAKAVRAAAAGHEALCNLATHIPPVSRMGLPGAWRQNDGIRTELSKVLAETALAVGAGRYIQESIAYVYADGGDDWIDEDSPVEPVANLESAIRAEANAATVTATGGTGVVLRFAAFYGPDSDTSLAMIKMARRRMALGAGPTAYVSSITTDDAASAVVAALSAPSGIYNVGDDQPVTRREFFWALADALGVRAPLVAPAGVIKLGGAKASYLARSQRVSNHRLKEATGWRPACPSVRQGWPAVIAAMAPIGTSGRAR